MLREISRPAADAAERRKLFTAEFPRICSAMFGPSGCAGGGVGRSGSGGRSRPGSVAGAPATLAVSFSYADSRSTVCPYFADSGLDDAAAVIASLPMVSISERGGRILVHATG